MKRELEEPSSESMISGSFGAVSQELEEIFLERVCEFERAELDTNFNRLIQRRVEMIPPAELGDCNLHAKLQEVLQTLGEMRCFLHDTDHLSDRELYTWLWTDGLREDTPDMAQLDGAWHTSPIGSCTEEDIAVHLTYYANKKQRLRWKREFPNDRLPSHCPWPPIGIRICRGRSDPLADCPSRDNWSANFAKIRCVGQVASNQTTPY